MSRDKQIEEMAQEICRTDPCVTKRLGTPCYQRCKAYIYAERAINAGYRKQSEVAREIFEEIDNMTNGFRIMNACAILDLNGLAELKKKYTEEGK